MAAATKWIKFQKQTTQLIHAPIVAARIGNLTTLIPGFAWTAKGITLPKHRNAAILIVGST